MDPIWDDVITNVAAMSTARLPGEVFAPQVPHPPKLRPPQTPSASLGQARQGPFACHETMRGTAVEMDLWKLISTSTPGWLHWPIKKLQQLLL